MREAPLLRLSLMMRPRQLVQVSIFLPSSKRMSVLVKMSLFGKRFINCHRTKLDPLSCFLYSISKINNICSAAWQVLNSSHCAYFVCPTHTPNNNREGFLWSSEGTRVCIRVYVSWLGVLSKLPVYFFPKYCQHWGFLKPVFWMSWNGGMHV